MEQSNWEELIDELINMCSPAAYQKFNAVAGKGFDEGSLAPYYHTSPLLLLTAAMFDEVMASANADLSPIAKGLERLWQAVINDRDASTLPTGDDEEEDDFWVSELEILRDEADGLLAIFEAYTADKPLPDDANALVQQALLRMSSNHREARKLFGQAGIAFLRGAKYWSLWHHEVEAPPAHGWMRGLFGLLTFVKINELYPLASIAEQRQKYAAREETTVVPDAEPESFEEKLSPAEQRLMKILLCGKEKLSDKQIAEVSFTPEIINRLSIVVQGEDYAYEDSEGKGYAPIHAAKLLGLSGSPEAVDALLFALYKSEPDDILCSEATFALEALGPLALPALLDSMQYSTDFDLKLFVAGALSKAGQGDERAFRALEAYYHETTWDEDRPAAVSDLAVLGDRRALPLLHKALNDRDITPMGINETIAAIEELDPNHDPAELKRLEAKARQRYDNHLVRFDKYGQAFCRDCGSLMEKDSLGQWQHVEPEPLPARASRPPFPALNPLPPVDPRFKNVGRNDPCPCGSGKKFKHCHGSGKERVN